VTNRRFLLTASVGVLALAVALVLAEILDAPWLRLVAVAMLVLVVIAREAWIWRGARREWLAMYGTLIVVVIVLAFVAQRL
jgi:hypothetical protein